MSFIIIDTTQKESYVVICKDKRSIKKTLFTEKDQSKILLSSIDALLKKSDILLSDLDYVSVCTGPGTFTGTRIGVITAKTIAFAMKIPILCFHSLQLYFEEELPVIVPAANDTCFLFFKELKKCTYKEAMCLFNTFITPNPEIISTHLPEAKLINKAPDVKKIIELTMLKIANKEFCNNDDIRVTYAK